MSISGRESYKDELTKLAFENERIICIEADLGGKKHPFEQSHPDRFFNLGIAELASIDIAAGLAEAGFIPFFSTFSSFAALRAAESIKLAMGYMEKNMKIVAAYGGVSGGWFGTTHHCLEDIAIIQTFQNIRIACPHGEIETRQVIREAAQSQEPYYIRLARNAVYDSLDRAEESSCRELLIEGAERANAKLCLISVGEEATELCKTILQENDSVVHAHVCYVDLKSLKSYIDELKQISDTFLVVEEHRATGSSASALALLMPECKVYSHDCGEKWPMYGGTHQDVLDYLGFGLAHLQQQIHFIGGTDGF
ncbi:transketolase [Paenibacillus glacialis]|uniref:Transketolase n=1 Tax=Paenibacillus glacialis TaxID=494026 RepID=A0A168D8H0_9BACL|nr:transketolase [Paenibacillus glacialis]OAB33969.1 transketolase [Paenibacillus glacialis]